jgi:hypothetical protein
MLLQEENMKRGLALMVCVVFTIMAVAGLCWAQKHWKSEGRVELVGKVVKGGSDRFVLKTAEGDFIIGGADLHSGADPSPWLGKKVKVSGEVIHKAGGLKKHITVDKFEAAE